MTLTRAHGKWLHAAAVGSIVAALAVLAVSCDYDDLDGIPPGFADGIDNEGTVTTGDGLTQSGSDVAVDFDGDGVATTVSRSDHRHSKLYDSTETSVALSSDGAGDLTGAGAHDVTGVFTAAGGSFTVVNTGAEPNIVGGDAANSVQDGAVGAAISGGGNPTDPNSVTDDYGAVGGGVGNTAGDGGGVASSARYATVCGGQNNTASAARAVVAGGSYNTASGGNSIVGGGWMNSATGTYATISGGNQGNAGGNSSAVGGGQQNSAAGNLSAVAGGAQNTASGIGSFIGSGFLNEANSLYSAVAGGTNNIAGPGNYATVGGGFYNDATGAYSAVGGGDTNVASVPRATVGGGSDNVASGQYSTVPGGKQALASHYGEMAYSSGSFSTVTSGMAQTSVYVPFRVTTNATQSDLYLGGQSQRITVGVNRVMTFEILVVARDINNGDSGGWTARGVIKNVGGAVSFVGVPSVTLLAKNVGAWAFTVQANDALDALRLLVTGVAGRSIRWVAYVRTVEVQG